MAAKRLLSKLIASCVIGGVLICPTPAQNKPSNVPPIPRWVRLGMMSNGTAAWASLAKRTIDKASIDAPLETAMNAGDLMIASRNLYRQNAALLAGRSRALSVKNALRFAMIQGSIMVYDLANGNLTASDAGRNLVQLGAGALAGSVTAAGMLWFAGSIGTASTGVAISTLSGAAYTSAATAYLGGGALSAGGGGMAMGSAVLSGGVVVAVVVVGYTVFKVWNIADPSERDALRILSEGLQQRADLTDASTPYGAALMAETRRLEATNRKAK